MAGKIILIILVALLILFIFASFKVASWVDEELDDDYERRKKWKS